jgi:ATP-dependent DNA helicase RecG
MAFPDIKSLLSRGMGPDLHWFPEDVSPSRLAATLVGMANASGGVVLLGISPRSAEIQGISDAREVVDRVFQAALLSDPPLVLPIPTTHKVGKACVLWISVPSGLPNVYNLEGRFLGREGRQTNPLSARQLRQLLLERGVVQFESQVPPGANFDDLDPVQVEAYLEALHLPGNEPPKARDILLQRGCLKLVDNGLYPTYAGLLVFGRHPQQWLPNATLLAARFPSVAYMDHYIKQDIRGTLPEQLRQAEAFLRDNLRSMVRLVGLAHLESLEYPFEAVRELLVNAVAHRDYNIQGDNIHLHIFSDRLEVHSPGGLPGPVTLDNLLEARFSRNPVIVQVLSDMGFIERLGYGLDRVVAVMRQKNMRPPLFEEVGGTFRVTLYSAMEMQVDSQDVLTLLSTYTSLDLNPRQQKALGYLALHKRITNSEYQEQCPDVHPETLRRDLADLVSRGVLIKVGDKRATYYIVK